MTESQRVEQAWETPTLDEIAEISRGHVGAMESSADDEIWILSGMHHVIVRTVGRRTGNEHKVALPTWRDPDGHRIVVASFAGATKPPVVVREPPRHRRQSRGAVPHADRVVLVGARDPRR